MTIGRRVEQMLQNPETPNELKLKGFANVLLEEWNKEHPQSIESSRSLNMMYSRLLRQDDPQDNLTTIYATWTPKHNGVLKDCLAVGTLFFAKFIFVLGFEKLLTFLFYIHWK